MDFRLWLFDAGLACCAVEFGAATSLAESMAGLGVDSLAPEPEQANVLVVAGTVTDKMGPAVRRLYERMPEPRHVISFGSCANTGGPYWDSYCVVKGVDSLVPVDVYVPGCPPRPDALLDGLATLESRLEERASR